MAKRHLFDHQTHCFGTLHVWLCFLGPRCCITQWLSEIDAAGLSEIDAHNGLSEIDAHKPLKLKDYCSNLTKLLEIINLRNWAESEFC